MRNCKNKKSSNPCATRLSVGGGVLQAVSSCAAKFGFTLAEGATHVAQPKNVGKAAFTKPSRGTSDSERRTIINGNRVFRFDCERCRLTRGAAFTLAEVLITLGIIGVVAAMTIPSLIEKHQKQVTINKLKKAYSTLSQMVIRTYADNGSVSDFLNSGDVVDADKTKEFFDTYWRPYFNAPMVANPEFYNTVLPFTGTNGKEFTTGIYTKYAHGRILFSTQDGTIYFLHFMDWDRDEEGHNLGIARYTTTQTVTVDINGTKGPNKYGRDVFNFVINFDSNIVRPACYGYTTSQINSNCSKTGYGQACAAKIINDGWQIKDDYPW